MTASDNDATCAEIRSGNRFESVGVSWVRFSEHFLLHLGGPKCSKMFERFWYLLKRINQTSMNKID